MLQETLKGGAIRLAGQRAAFVYQRLRPGVLLTVCKGRDTGEFGSAPLDIVEAERRRFLRPVMWYLDASAFVNAASPVFERWTDWLREHASSLARLHVLTATESARLTISIARHLADSTNRVILHSDRAGWLEAVLHAAPGLTAVPDAAGRFAEPAIEVQTTRRGGVTTFKGPASAFRFERIADDAVLCRFEGDDTGDLTGVALDEMERRIEKSRAPIRWFLDLRNARTVSPDVSRVWTEWIGARRERFAKISAFSFDPLFPLVLTMAKYQSRTENLFRVHRKLEPFERELARASAAGQ